MKVETGLIAGAVVQNAAEAASQTASNAQNFLAQATRQAQDITGTVMNKTTSVWNCLTRS
jgi:hypothetical protein